MRLIGRENTLGEEIQRPSSGPLQNSPTCNRVKELEIDGGVTRGSLNFKRNWYD